MIPDAEVRTETNSPRYSGVGLAQTSAARRGFDYGTPPEGEVQKAYYVPSGRGAVYEQMLNEFLKSPTLKVKHFSSFFTNTGKPEGGLDLLFVQDTEANVPVIEDFLTKLETRIPQVEIEAKIAEVVISDDFEVGATTTFTEEDFNELTLFDTATSKFNTRTFIESVTGGGAVGFQGGLLNFGTIQDELLINIIFEALARKENTKIIAEPTLSVLSGFTGKVVTGERTPVQTARIVNNAVTVDTQFEQTGVVLEITPTVLGEDDIQLHVKPDVSVVTGFTTSTTAGGVTSPIISNRNADTIVMVKNGHSLVIGGLNSKQIVEIETRIPILGSIPLIKHLFRSVREETVTTRLYFVITPRITNDQGQYSGNILYPPDDDSYED
ncbi:MAG: type II secretion system protein GspD [Planctomycetota bacterium]